MVVSSPKLDYPYICLLFSSFSNACHFAYVCLTALKLSRVTKFGILFLAMGFVCLSDENKFMLIGSGHILNRSIHISHMCLILTVFSAHPSIKSCSILMLLHYSTFIHLMHTSLGRPSCLWLMRLLPSLCLWSRIFSDLTWCSYLQQSMGECGHQQIIHMCYMVDGVHASLVKFYSSYSFMSHNLAAH